MSQNQYLCLDRQLEENQCLQIDLKFQDGFKSAFLIRFNRQYYCYLNSCPHTGSELNWNPNQFLDAEQQFIQCSVHGALFEKDTGKCVYGPCSGASLQSVPLNHKDGHWYAMIG